jgi:hypothetical protein
MVVLWPVRARAFADPTLAERFSVGGVLLPGLGVLCIAAILAGGFFMAWKARHRVPNDGVADIKCALLIGTLLLVLPLLLTLNLNAMNPGDFLHGRYTYLPPLRKNADSFAGCGYTPRCVLRRVDRLAGRNVEG